MQVIKAVQRLGYPLTTIADLFAATTAPPPEGYGQTRHDELLVDVNERLTDLEAIRRALSTTEPFPKSLPSLDDI